MKFLRYMKNVRKRLILKKKLEKIITEQLKKYLKK